MRKALGSAFLIALSVLLIAGCQTATTSVTTTTALSPTTTVPASSAMSSAEAASFSSVGVNLAADITGSMGGWAESGSITGISGMAVKAAALGPLAAVTPETDGWYHVTESVTTAFGTVEADMHVKLVTDEGVVSDIYLYGIYKYDFNYAGAVFSYTENFGSISSPFHGAATWNAGKTDVTKISISGTMNFNITASSTIEGSHTVAMAMTFTGYELPVTTGDDYPTGTISVAVTYDGVAQPGIAITFNGTETATLTYGTYTTTFTLDKA